MKNCLFPLTLLSAAALPACAPLPPAPAHADMQAECAPLLDSLRQARAQPQVAQYRVDLGMVPVSGVPAAFRVDDRVHESEDGMPVAHLLQPGHDPLVESLQAELSNGAAWCRNEGRTTFQGAAALRIGFRHPRLEARHQPATVLIDALTGLPVWHGYAGMDEGFAWFYGPGVPSYPPPSTRGAAP